MADTRLLAANPADVLRQGHDRLRHLFEEHARTAPEQSEARTALFKQIRHELRVHGEIEREFLYPSLKDSARSVAEDHVAMDGLVGKLSEMKPSDKSYDALLKLLEENFALHSAVEERELFPRLGRLSPRDRQELTLKLENARDRFGASD